MGHPDHEHDENCNHEHDDHEHDENCEHNHDHHHHEHDENCDHDHEHEHDDDHEEEEEHVHGEHCNHHHMPRRKVPKHDQELPDNVVPQTHKHDTFDDYLHCAISRAALDEVRQLLDYYNGPDMAKYVNETRFDDFNSPLSMACYSGDLDIVKLLIEKGASAKDTDEDESVPATCFFYACYGGSPNLDLIKHVYQLRPETLNVSHRRANYTPLMAACQRGSLEVVQFLLSKGADINTDGAKGLSPFMVALDGMSDPHRDDKQHLTASMIALRLVKSGADPNHRTNMQFTAIWRACMKRQGDQIKLLATMLPNVDVNARSYDMSPAYAIIKSEDDAPHACGGHHHHHVVPQTSREDCLKLLIDSKKVNLDTVDEETHTPLSLALELGYKGAAIILLENGANAKRKISPDIPTAHDMITKGKDQDLKAALSKSYGCKVCGKKSNLMRCSRCQNVWYCARECQVKDWSSHKNACKSK